MDYDCTNEVVTMEDCAVTVAIACECHKERAREHVHCMMAVSALVGNGPVGIGKKPAGVELQTLPLRLCAGATPRLDELG